MVGNKITVIHAARKGLAANLALPAFAKNVEVVHASAAASP